MKFGYARCLPWDPDASSQVTSLLDAGCGQCFVERNLPDADSGSSQMLALLEASHPGDELVIWRLDCLARSLANLADILGQTSAHGLTVQSLHDPFELDGQFFASLQHIVQFERRIVAERTRAGLAAARASGRSGGRPSVISEKQRQIALALLSVPGTRVADVALHLGVSRSTLYRTIGPVLKPK